MTFRGALENLNNFKVKRLLMIAAQDYLLTEAVKSGARADLARDLLANPEYNAERLANLAAVHATDLDEESPDSAFTKAIVDIFNIAYKIVD